MTHVKTVRKTAGAMIAMCVALASSAITQTAAQAQASSALPIERDVLEKLPPDARAAIEAIGRKPGLGTGGPKEGELFSRSWLTLKLENITPSASILDREGNMVLISSDFQNDEMLVEKYDVSGNSGPVLEWSELVTEVNNGRKVLADLDGNVFVQVSTASLAGQVIKFDAERGTLLWSSETFRSSGDCAIDQDGAAFVAESNSTSIRALRIDPASGVTAWSSTISASDIGSCIDGAMGISPPRAEVDPFGDLWVTFGATGPGGAARQYTVKFDPISGDTICCSYYEPSVTSLQVLDTLVTADGRFAACGVVATPADSDNAFFSVFGANGEIDTFQIGTADAATFTDVVVDHLGRLHLVGYSQDYAYVRYARIGTDYALEAETTDFGLLFTQFSGEAELDIDLLGNPYLSNGGSFAGDSFHVLKLDGDPDGPSLITGTVWNDVISLGLPNSSPVSGSLVVDNAGSVFTTSQVISNSGTFSLFIKHTQPYLSVPITYKSAATFQVEEAGLWSPDDPSFVYEYQFFDTGTASFDTMIGDTFEICYVFDCDDFGAQFGVDFDARLKSGFRAEANGGSFDAVVPVQIDMTVPSDQKLFPGKVIDPPIMTSWKMSPAARLTAAGSPTFNAGITGDLDGGFRLDYDVTVFSDRLVGGEIFDERLRLGPGYVPALNVQSLIHAFIGDDFVPGYTYEFEDARGFFGGDVRYPDLSAQGVFEQTPTGGIATSNAEDLLLELRANISEMAAAAAGATISLGDEYEYAGMNLEWEVAILQLIIRARFNLVQDFEVEFNTPEIEFSFSDGLPTQTITAGDPLSFPLPLDKDVVITPTVHMSATVRNNTGLNLVPGGSFTPIEAGAEIYYDAVIDEFEIYSFDIDHWVPNIDVNASPIGPLSMYTDDWTIDFPPVELNPIVMSTENDSAPKLSASSRESVSMMIYDQTNPQASQYNVLTSGSFKMLLYGEGLDLGGFPGYNESLTVHIAHHGAELQLTAQNGLRTIINRNTMLVEIPNYLRVIPGVARVWVTAQANGLKMSETLDLAISYPRPRLDTVNPNLWAADPALLEVPISVIDGQSTIGLDTFIARRDYFVKLRDELWNEARVGGVAADDFFSSFDFEKLPGFPLVLFDGSPLPRFEQPTDSGILNVRLPPSNYASPGLVDVMLCNPGPGGGPSIVRQLNIAAPRPALMSIEPALVEPDEGPVVLTIRGPSNVPFDPSNEEPKYGNFTADTQVFVDGVVVGDPGLPGVTRVNGPGSITVELDTTDLQEGLVLIQAFTPANGSQYLEQVIDPKSGEPGLGLVDSGGLSAPIYFEVGFPRPEIARLVPPSTTVNSVRMLEPALTHNVSIAGENFRSDAVAYVNGQPRSTTFESDGLVRVLLEPLDLALPGMLQIAVESGGDISAPALFFVDPAP